MCNISRPRDITQTGEEVESYEGVLVSVGPVTVTSINQYDWTITQNGYQTLIDDDMATMAIVAISSSIKVW